MNTPNRVSDRLSLCGNQNERQTSIYPTQTWQPIVPAGDHEALAYFTFLLNYVADTKHINARLPTRAVNMYDNTCYTLTSESTPDPFMTFTAGNKVEIWSSEGLADFGIKAKKQVVWTPPPLTEHSADLWAPELHAIRGRWYIYYAAAHPARGNKSHRMYVLGGGPASGDPTRCQWEFLGRIKNLQDQWAIDGTIMQTNQDLYMIYSGWPLGDASESDLIQELFIVKLADPTHAASQPVKISAPEFAWEFTNDGNGAHGINEGPQFLLSPHGKWKGIVYSCAGSWTHEYKMATLEWNGQDPMKQTSWVKGVEPLLQAPKQGLGLWGPGHGSFVCLGQDILCVFHGTDRPTDGWDNRKARCQLVAFTDQGPFMGTYSKGRNQDHEPQRFGQGLAARLRGLFRQACQVQDKIDSQLLRILSEA
ncbi:glycosyl hydrolase [Xylariales sp. PMI_506]|nr:glycosyl hydrolase [Xylariales sp. PMI_506]